MQIVDLVHLLLTYSKECWLRNATFTVNTIGQYYLPFFERAKLKSIFNNQFCTMRLTNGIYFLFFSKLNLLFFFVVVLFSVMKADLNPYQMYFFQTSKKAFIEMGCFTSSTRKRSEFAVFLLIIFLHLDQERSKYGDIVRSAVQHY